MIIYLVNQTRICAYPQAPVARAQYGIDGFGGKRFRCQRAPLDKTYTVKPEESGFSSYPKVPIGGLGQGAYTSTKESVLNPPRGVAVLRDMSLWIQCERYICLK